MLRWPAALLLVALLATPAASAFSSTPNDLLIAYDAAATPVVVGAGEPRLTGAITGGLFLGGASRTELRSVPHVTLIDGTRTHELVDVTIEISSGGGILSFGQGSMALDVGAPYAIALALPQAPIPAEPGSTPPSGFLLAGEALGGAARWSGEPLDLAPMDAVITLRAADGQPLPGWESQHVNPDATSPDVADRATVALRLAGAFDARLASTVLGGATDAGTDLALSLARAPEDRFLETEALLQATTQQYAAEGPSFGGPRGPLSVLEQMSGLLNGGLLVVAGDGTTQTATPRVATWGEEEFRVGAFNLLRGDGIGVEWADGEMRVAGEPDVALGRDGFAVDPPARLGFLPLVSLFLWVVAIGCIVWWFVDRPPKAKSELTYRLLSAGAWALVLLLTLFLWDRSFTQTFGTGVLQVVREQGVSGETLPQIGVLAALELVPWSIAALLFALPVRIAAGVALQQLGKGKSFKGLASAAGLVSLAVLGPIYALWCFNLVWARAGAMMGGG